MKDWQTARVSAEAKFQSRDLELVNAWADEHEDKFDREFVDSITAAFHRDGFLTEKQYNSLQRIIEGFRIEDWAEREGLTFRVKET